VAVIGDFAFQPRYQGGGSSAVNPTRLDTVIDQVEAAGLVLAGRSRGFRRDGAPDPALAREAVAAAAGADAVLVWLGLSETAETEGLERPHLALPPAQTDLLAALHQANPRIAVVLALGGAVETPWLGCCQALVHGFLAGQAGAGAMLDVLTGAVNPSGRLAETMPRRLDDHPTAGVFPHPGRRAEYREGLRVGYRHYAAAGELVAFPFGFGLSYTTFEHRGLAATPEQARVTVANTGTRDGADVVQVYVHRPRSGVDRPLRELKGFARVVVPAGGSAEVAIPLGPQAFRHFDVETGRWEIEAGDYEVQLGASATDIRASATVTVAGAPAPSGLGPGLASPGGPPPAAGRPAPRPDGPAETLPGRPPRALSVDSPGQEPDPTGPAGRRPLAATDLIADLAVAPGYLGRRLHRMLQKRLDRAAAGGGQDLNTVFLLGVPFDRLAKLAGGAVDAATADGLLEAANGHVWRGLSRAARAAVRLRRADRATARELARLAAESDTSH
jgi:beta-glucosidase